VTVVERQSGVAEKAGVSSESLRLGERIRQLRVAADLTQSQLAGGRFSKAYLSQVERGETRPTPETVAWLASRLGVDPEYLSRGVSRDARAKAEAVLARAEALTEAQRYTDAVSEFRRIVPALSAVGSLDLRVRALVGEASALSSSGEIQAALELLTEARALVEGEGFGDLDRADILFRLGVCRYHLSSIATAVALFDQALALAERARLPSDRLRLEIFTWRARCYQRQRDFEAAREDVERALDLADVLQDTRALGSALFQASVLAERQGRWVLARTYAEQAKTQFELLADRRNVGRLHNNLGGLEFLLDRPEQAVTHLKQAFSLALEVGLEHEAATAVSSLAQVHLRTGNPAKAEEQALHALNLIGDREDMLDEVGNARLVYGRALLEQNRLDEAEQALADAEQTLAQLSSASHCAAAWIAQGDLATRQGSEHRAATLYRRAAEALQDFRF
jgi:tetratricopeptide (TPR) repeat protein